eukprot:3236990-Amphidinium_carterae.1
MLSTLLTALGYSSGNGSLQQHVIAEHVSPNGFGGFKDFQKAELDFCQHGSKNNTEHHLLVCSFAYWKLTALDISTAFLQELKYGNQGRVIHLKVDA